MTQYFQPEMGAPQSRLFETAKGLIELGWNVKVVTAMPSYPTGKVFQPYRSKFACKEYIEGIEIWRYWIYASNAIHIFPRILNMLSFSFSCLFSYNKIRRFKPDYIFTESPPLILALSGLVLSKITGAKHIMNVSDIWPLSAFELGAISKGLVYRGLEGLERFLYRHSFACTGQSQQIIDHLQIRGSSKTHLFRNGVDVNRFKSREKVFDTPGPDRIKIVYAGLLGVAQGIYDLCLHINFAELEVEFHIYGEGAERNQIANYLDQHQERGIFLHPPVSREEVPDILMKYDITIIPLLKPIYGAVPSKIYEAMAAGLPILFSGGGEGATIIDEYKLGWICTPSDYSDIKQTISQIVHLSKDELVAIRNNCLQSARMIFNRKLQIEELSDFLS